MASTTAEGGGGELRTKVPARMDRLPWLPFHWLVLASLGVTWILDGLEITMVGAVGAVLQHPDSLGLTSGEIGLAGSIYVTGAVIGALGFGYLTDVYGRKVMFFITLGVYLGGAFLSAFSWDFWTFAISRAITGVGIGGEYAAINSAVDELMPARLRGRISLFVSSSYWAGAALAALATLVILDPEIFNPDIGWRVGFAVGAVLGLIILFLRQWVPESPRWLVTHAYPDRAEKVVGDIEERARARTGRDLDEPEETLVIHPRRHFGFAPIVRAIFVTHRKRSLLCVVLMVTQSFLYNAVFFTYALILTQFYGVSAGGAGIYLLPLALGNMFGAILLAPLFDRIGRRIMISATYGIAAVLLAITGWLFAGGYLDATTQTLCWSAIFFFASAAAGSAYLTTGEIFPLETRALAIAFFYAVGTAIGGIAAPGIFGYLIGTGERTYLMWGYFGAAGLMLVAAVTEAILGIDAERKSLETISDPLAAEA